MKRIRTFGLAVLTALALTAVVGAAGASAGEFKSEVSPTTINSPSGSKMSPYGLQEWHFHSVQQECDPPALSGSLSTPSKAFGGTPSDSKCYFNFSAAPELKMNGCNFVYRVGAKTGTNIFNGSVDIVCPAGKSIQFLGGSLTCKVDVAAQRNLAATFENVGTGTERAIKVTMNATGLKHTQVSGHDCFENIGSYSDGTWTGSWKVQGSSGGKPAGIWVSTSEGLELPPSGIAISGSTPKLVAGTYPIYITGNQKEGIDKHKLTLPGAGSIGCSTAKLSTSASGSTAQLEVQAEYGGCTVFGFPGTVKMNGCAYVFNVLNQAPVGSTYAGHADIACPAGKTIEAVALSAGLAKCTATIPAQTTDSEGLKFINESLTSTITLNLAVGGIDYHLQEGTGVGRCKTADGTTGTYTGTSFLVGSY